MQQTFGLETEVDTKKSAPDNLYINASSPLFDTDRGENTILIGEDTYKCLRDFLLSEKIKLYAPENVGLLKELSEGNFERVDLALCKSDYNWIKYVKGLLVKVMFLRFMQHPELHAILKETNKKDIIFVSDNTIYGMMVYDERKSLGRLNQKWVGHNLVGKALVEVRDMLFS